MPLSQRLKQIEEMLEPTSPGILTDEVTKAQTKRMAMQMLNRNYAKAAKEEYDPKVLVTEESRHLQTESSRGN